MQPVLADIIHDGAILGFGIGRPGQISTQVGWLSLQCSEIISCCRRVSEVEEEVYVLREEEKEK